MSRRLLAVVLALSAWITGTVAGALTTTAPASAAMPLLEIGKAHAGYGTALSGNDPIFILVLGSDARPGTPMDHGLSDSIHILGINPGEHRATLYGIPRDSWVALANGGTNKINSAMPSGGPEAEIATVEQLTGITFDYYVLTGFNEFERAVDDIGGLVVDVPYYVEGYERNFPAGVQRMSGPEALGYARTRHSLPLGDFDRSLNQGRLMVSALAQFRGEFAKDTGTMFTWIGAGLRNTQTTLPIDELTKLAYLAMDIPATNVTNLVALGAGGMVGSMSVVYLSDANQALWQDLGADGYILQKDIPDLAQPSP